MAYQSKTTVLRIPVWRWSEKSNCSLSSRFSAAYAVAVQIALHCQMDIMSIAPFSLEEKEEECCVIAVYVNNGHTFDDIRSSMNPLLNNKSQKTWLIQDLYEWQGLIECLVAVRGDNETWN